MEGVPPPIYGPHDPLPPIPIPPPWVPSAPVEDFLPGPEEHPATPEDNIIMVSVLERAGISCCLVGVNAILYFGAPRDTDTVDICVPSSRYTDARRAILNRPDLFTTSLHKNQYTRKKKRRSYAWFKRPGVWERYVLIPDSDVSFTCHPDAIDRAVEAPHLPFPKASLWIQALLQSNMTDLEDMVDALALTVNWGRLNLPQEFWPKFELIVRLTKGRMLGPSTPEDLYDTRFRMKKPVDEVARAGAQDVLVILAAALLVFVTRSQV